MMDMEILQLQEDLQRMRKQRALLQLRREIAREQQLLAEAQQSLGLDSSALPVVERVERAAERPRYNQQSAETSQAHLPAPTGDGIVQGIKRSHSESSRGYENGEIRTERREEEGQVNTGSMNTDEAEQQQNIDGREKTSEGERRNGTENGQEDAEVPPTFTVKKQFRGVNRKEYSMLVEFLESHFAQYEHYYAPDERRIEEGLRHVSPDIARAWGHAAVTDEQMGPTWPNFCQFLQSKIVPFVDPAVAQRNYHSRSQRQEQTVREFANHLGSWEQHLEVLLTDEQRIRNLWEKILPEVRDEARPFQYQSDRFLEHVAHLQTVESRMPSRSYLQRRVGHRQYHPRNGSKNAPKHPKVKKPWMNNS